MSLVKNENILIKKERNATFDLVKLILALFVVAIHSQLYPQILNPLLRLAVPLFFIISSYFFFGKLKSITEKTEKRRALWRFIKRNITLYAFYFIVLLPHTLYFRNYFSNGVLKGILVLIKSLLFASTFSASWYIQATIFATLIIFFLSRKMKNSILLIITLLIYLLVCVRSSYWELISGYGGINKIAACYEYFFGSPIVSAPAALLWITLGKCFAESKWDINKNLKYALLPLFTILLFIEGEIVKRITEKLNPDCYVFLIPVAILVFLIIKDINIKSNVVFQNFGKLSVIIYTTHSVYVTVFNFIFKNILSYQNNIIIFVSVAVFSICTGIVILYLEKYKYFKWLKFAY